MTEMERMLAGRLYIAQGEEIASAFLRCRRLTDAFNRAAYDDFEGRNAILRELFGALGEGASIAPPFRCDYGTNIFIGDRFMANYDCIMLDVCRITIGDDVFFGPRVGLYTAAHPLDAAVRAEGLEYGRPIAIGNGVWLGGNVVVNPGVTVGDGAVVGSGSVVTRDIPPNVVAAGNPCRVLREITEDDRAHWRALRDEYRAWQEEGKA